MAIASRRTLYIASCTLIGACLGYLHARNAIDDTIAYMISNWGWVCGTGLTVPLYIWTPTGAYLGCAFGKFTWRLFRKVGRLNTR